MLQMDIQDLPELRVARVRHVGPFCDLAGAFERISAWAGARGLFGPDTRVLGIFHDDPKVTPEAELRSDAAVTVGPDVEGEGDIEIAAVPGGAHAVGVLEGPCEKLHEAYAWIHSTWLPTSGREVAGGACFEVYLNDARSVAPEEIRTAIHVPLR